ncbi:cation diffusion facilitator family transporter [Knoellia sp. CPCC 206453]|uniref:cation diffusion facilitator family transporter n=1 Tax=Knoellia pratensis TaxID=3404796 RepID=UPI00360863BF
MTQTIQFSQNGVRRATLIRRARLLAGATVAYNVVEGVIAIAAGRTANSSALVSFGLDSFVEVASGLIVLWQFRHVLPETRERLAQRLMAGAFFVLAAYVAVDAVRVLLGSHGADASPVGVGLAIVSLLVMPFLSGAQRATGRALGSGTVVSDSKQTMLCTYLSAVLLVGLLANATLGWWWADPLAGLVIAAVAVREGLESWRGDACYSPSLPSASVSADVSAGTCDDACCGTEASR